MKQLGQIAAARSSLVGSPVYGRNVDSSCHLSARPRACPETGPAAGPWSTGHPATPSSPADDEGTAVVDPHADVAAEGREYAHPVWDGVERGGDLGAIRVRPRLVPR